MRQRPTSPARAAGARAVRATGLLVRLVALLAVGAAASSPARAGDEAHDFVGVGKCRTCHEKELIGNQVAAWRDLPHARAYTTLRSDASRQIARAQGLATPAHESPACLACHATAATAPPERLAYALSLEDGVQCEACHGPGRDYRKKTIMSEIQRARAEGLWDAGDEPAICTGCHNPRSPTFDPERYTLADGSTTGFDFEQAKARILHPIPPDVKGRYLELDEARKEAERAARDS